MALSLQCRSPDLFWPEDWQWFAATDVDYSSLYVGGGHDFINELSSHVHTYGEPVVVHYPLQIED